MVDALCFSVSGWGLVMALVTGDLSFLWPLLISLTVKAYRYEKATR
jgi:hypothetical protein